jgi:hypothetical protein
MDRNRYAEIMAQYQQAQPFSFTGYPSTYTGGYNVSQPQQYTAPVNSYADIMEQSAMTGPGGMPEAPSAWSQMTPAERAAYYAANPTQGQIALRAQDLFGNFSLMGQTSKNTGADKWYSSRLEKMGYDPQTFAYGPPNLAGGFVPVTPQQIAAEAAAREAARQPIRETSQSDGEDGGAGKGNGAITGGGGLLSSQSSATRAALRTGSGYYEGGYVSMQHLEGPDPEGPDDGYASLKDGEYVINDKAVKKYGIELMNAINSGKISKGKLRGLLEM